MDTPEPFPPEILQQIGRAAVNWSTIENTLTAMIFYVLGKSFSEEHLLSLFAHTAFAAKLEILNTLVADYGPIPDGHPLSRYKALSSQLSGASKLRNKIVHSHYSHVRGTLVAFSLKARGELDIRKEEVTVLQMKRENNQIASALRGLKDMLAELQELHKSNPQRGQ